MKRTPRNFPLSWFEEGPARSSSPPRLLASSVEDRQVTSSQKPHTHVPVFTGQHQAIPHVLVPLSRTPPEPRALSSLLEMQPTRRPHQGSLQLGQPLSSQR